MSESNEYVVKNRRTGSMVSTVLSQSNAETKAEALNLQYQTDEYYATPWLNDIGAG